MNKKFLPWFLLFCAIGLSGTAAYYSVVGLSIIFSAVAFPVIIMGSFLEISKIAIATYLHDKWKETYGILKIYLTIALVTLSVLTSIGIYGLLSTGFQKNIAGLEINNKKIENIEVKNYQEIFKEYKKTSLISFLLVISIFYGINQSNFDNIIKVAEIGQEADSDGSGFFSKLLEIQNSGILGYFIVFIPKTLFLLIGLIARYNKFLDFNDLYNNVIQFSQSVVNAIAIFIVIKKRVSLNNIFLFLGIIYCIIFALSPIYSPRYFFPFYIFLLLAISSTDSKLKSLTIHE